LYTSVMIGMFLYVVVIPILVYVLGTKISHRYKLQSNKLLLAGAALLFSISLFIPSPLIHGRDTQFLTHVFGGGVFMGLICLYFRPLVTRDLRWYEELILLFMFTCTFGVINELYELFAFESGISSQSVTDTSWDLLANTLGVLLFFGIYKGAMRVKGFSS
jgi:hypothetical protein